MMAQAERIYILMIKVNELFSLFWLRNYLIVNEKESIFSVFLLSFFQYKSFSILSGMLLADWLRYSLAILL